VPVLVGHHRRHNPLIAKAHQVISEGKLGRLINVTALWQLQKPDSYFETPGAASRGRLLADQPDPRPRSAASPVRRGGQVQAFTRNDVRGFANEDSAAVCCSSPTVRWAA
jgi:hypothetical protein